MIEQRGEVREQWTKAGPVVSSLPEDEIRLMGERREASAAEPGALGLFGFAVGTLVVAIPLSGFTPAASAIATFPELLVFAGIAQFVAGVWALRRGNTFAGTAFGVYGANNTLVATYLLMKAAGVFPGNHSDMLLLGIELFCFAYISLVLGVAALTVNLTFVAILWALVPGFGLVAVHDVGGLAVIGHIGGYFLILSAGLAFYGASALVVNSSFRRPVLPLISRA
ncbi:MAG: acetate uptake transporter [Acidimicrobiales bacterium]